MSEESGHRTENVGITTSPMGDARSGGKTPRKAAGLTYVPPFPFDPPGGSQADAATAPDPTAEERTQLPPQQTYEQMELFKPAMQRPRAMTARHDGDRRVAGGGPHGRGRKRSHCASLGRSRPPRPYDPSRCRARTRAHLRWACPCRTSSAISRTT